ncbi:MAG: phospholipid carrier-dependent glycosyltransferase [Anaerolineae bacterium]|jgi:4-amino-4-deoxy-L-arabinose transferase-like glycosyltransferase|nr:phospholipid carrier-dependent glycosyltransferase [Anaerolineae bacterium]MBT7076076.1 phospholipid carrier-dependent glycosyltransferase [Anaerolineae bacterium]
MYKKIKQQMTAVFSNDGKLDIPLIGIFVVINIIVLVNAVFHHPKIGYDVSNHLTYMQTILDGMPNHDDTPEFFSPPLPYVLPAFFDKACELVYDDEPHIPINSGGHIIFSCRKSTGKFAQSLNVLLSFSTLFVILLICEYLRPHNRFYKFSTLFLFSLLTVYYKTFSQARGEPYVVFFIVLSAYFLLRTLDPKPKKTTFVFLGISLGLLILSRQWGFFIFPAIAFSGIWLIIKKQQEALKLIKPLMGSFIIAAFLGGWFYLYLYIQHGSFTAFNIEENQRMSFDEVVSLTRKTRIKNMDLFRNPIRPNFYYEPIPVFYSEIWGDYWGYFTFIKEKSYYGDLGLGNSTEVGPYLGRVNFISIIPTLILGMGWLFGAYKLFERKKPFSIEDAGSALFFFISTSSIIAIPSPKKA